MARRGNDGSDTPQNRTRNTWFMRGHPVESDDHALSIFNLGLGARERRALAEENSRPWGLSLWAKSAVTDRAKEAQSRGRAKGGGGKGGKGGKK
jgi:hypothetical protein